MGKGYSCSNFLAAIKFSALATVTIFIQLQHSQYMARLGSLQILYQIKTIDTTVHTVEPPCM